MSAQSIKVHFSVDRWGDVNMHLSIGEQVCKVYLSSALFCFERFIGWLKQIDLRLPVRPFYIDEEGMESEEDLGEQDSSVYSEAVIWGTDWTAETIVM